jgi:hypothetical protein
MTKRYTPGPPDDEKRRAIRRSEADLVSAWDNYAAAIDAAKGGDQTRLVNLLRGHRQGSEPSQPPIGPPLLTPVTRVIRAVPARETNGTVLLSTVEQESPRAEPRRHCRRVH